jgi:surface polysaccharide O-acyltransferase-like enzyme
MLIKLNVTIVAILLFSVLLQNNANETTKFLKHISQHNICLET